MELTLIFLTNIPGKKTNFLVPAESRLVNLFFVSEGELLAEKRYIRLRQTCLLRNLQTHFFSFCTSRDRPGTKTEIIIVTIHVKVNSEEDTFTSI
jgi:hypothetical protein